MIIKKKLRDVTSLEFMKWKKENCVKIKCNDCVFEGINCSKSINGCYYMWIKNKDKYSLEFLNQEIEFEVLDILDDIEKKYLKAVIKPFKDRVKCIVKTKSFEPNAYFLQIYLKNFFETDEIINFPYFKPESNMYSNMELDKKYTLEELGLN